MHVHVFGICHFDPLGRGKLVARLGRVAADYATFPAFVAVEWGRDAFANVLMQRESFRRILEDGPERLVAEMSLRGAPLATARDCGVRSSAALAAFRPFADTLTASLGYEGDAHRDAVDPAVEVVWLDDGRPIGPELSANYALGRLGMYLNFWSDRSRYPADLGVLGVLSAVALARAREGAWTRRAAGSASGDPRDGIWAPRLLDRMGNGASEWAAIVVGAAHAGPDDPSSLLGWLSAAGYRCVRAVSCLEEDRTPPV